jgi:hypothetical protein
MASRIVGKVKLDETPEEEVEAVEAGVASRGDKPNTTRILNNDPKNYAWDEVVGAALSNLGKSAKETYIDPFLHPIDTLSGIAGLGADAFRKAGGFVAPEGTFGETPTLDALLNHYKETYGSGEGFRRALAEDPFGPISDLASVVSGGAGIAGKTAAAGGRVAKIARIAKKAADIADPFAYVSKGAQGAAKTGRDWVRQGVGATTGMGFRNIDEAFRAGEKGGKQADVWRKNARTDRPTDIRLEAEKGLDNLVGRRGRIYETDKNNFVKGNRTPLDKQKILQGYQDVIDSLTDRGKWLGGESSRATANKVLDDLNEFVGSGMLDPEGMLNLRKRTKAYEVTPGPGTTTDVKQSNRIVEGLAKGINDELERADPRIRRMDERYAKASDDIDEITKTFSLTDRASDDTVTRKLLSAGRDGVNANFGRRAELAEKLERAGSKGLLPAISGQAARSLIPHGLIGKIGGGGFSIGAGILSSLLGGSLPITALAALPGAIISSPRLMGEAYHGAGTIKRKTPKAIKVLAKEASDQSGRALRVGNVAERERALSEKEKFRRQFMLDNPDWKGM